MNDIGTELGYEDKKLPGLVNKDMTNILKFLGYALRSESHRHKSAVFEYGPYTLKDIHSIYRTTQRYIPEPLVWNVFRDTARAGGNLEVCRIWHPTINLSNVVFKGGSKERFKLSNPFIHNSFLRKYNRVKEDISDDYLQNEINKNVKQVGLTLLSLTSLADFDELRSGPNINQDNVSKALKITKLIYSGDLYSLIAHLLHANDNDTKLTFGQIRKGVIVAATELKKRGEVTNNLDDN
jgi:hypothetical protein